MGGEVSGPGVSFQSARSNLEKYPNEKGTVFIDSNNGWSTFAAVRHELKTVETVLLLRASAYTQLKLGVNESK